MSDGKASSHRPSLPSASARDQTEPVRYAALKDKLATFPARQSFKTRMFRSATGILGMGMESHSRLSRLATQAPAKGTPSRPGSPGSSSANARSLIGNEHAGLHGRGTSEAIGSSGPRHLPFLRVRSTSTQYCQEPRAGNSVEPVWLKWSKHWPPLLVASSTRCRTPGAWSIRPCNCRREGVAADDAAIALAGRRPLTPAPAPVFRRLNRVGLRLPHATCLDV